MRLPCADRIRALTGRRRIEPTSPGCRRSRRPEPGRCSTYQAGKPVQTNRASSVTSIDLEQLAREFRTQKIIFETARDVYENMQQDWKGSREALLAQSLSGRFAK